MDMIRVVVVDDHPLFLEGVVQSLDAGEDTTVVGKGRCADDAMQLAVELLPDVILLDVNMPGGGIAAARNLASACPVVHIGMLTASKNDDDVTQSLQAGAHGYILKGISGSELNKFVKALHAGDMYVSPDLAALLLLESMNQSKPAAAGTVHSLDMLTKREEQILQGIAQGWSNREIGNELSIAEKTVKNYVTNVLQKLNVRNRVEAAVLASNRMGYSTATLN
jgi:DNA-binding NarL/FixJ family response regulator